MSRLGYAVDLGTTTLDSCLIDCQNGDCISSASRRNRQSLYGSDVINRILNAERSVDNLNKMRELVVEDIIGMLGELLEKTGHSHGCSYTYNDINGICISGNTTMISILLGYDVSSLGRFPFDHELKGNVTINAKELFENVADIECKVILTGCAGAFLGGDVLAGIVYLNENRGFPFGNNRKAMLIDLGTNGEIVLNVNGKLYGTSTACGPAFEGCTRRQGIYGATTIDAIALAVKTKNLSKEGVLSDSYIQNGISINGVHLDMDIIRQILMAKSAIYSGIECICKAAKIKPEDVEEVYIAGGFGFHLDIENAIFIGLLPKAFKCKIDVCGNSSLFGAMLMLKDNIYVEKVDKLTGDAITTVQLADDDDYKNMLINNMVFK